MRGDAMASAITSERVFTTARDAELAHDVLESLRGPEGFLSVGHAPGTAMEPLPPEVGRLLQSVLGSVAAGSTVTISTVPEELTTSTAASLIGVSRPTLMKMVSEGRLSSFKVGAHHRLRSSDVFQFLRDRQKREQAAFDHLRDLLDD